MGQIRVNKEGLPPSVVTDVFLQREAEISLAHLCQSHRSGFGWRPEVDHTVHGRKVEESSWFESQLGNNSFGIL